MWGHPYFASLDNLVLILSAAALTAVFALGVAISIISGALDLSVTGAAALASCVCGYLMTSGFPIWLSLLAGMLMGLLSDAVNGLISLRGLNPLVITIGTLSVMAGLASVVSGGYNISGLDALKFMGSARYFGIPSHVYIVGVVYLIVTYFLTKTRHGIRLVAVGGNPEAVRRLGIDSGKYQLLGFILCGVFSALADLMQTALVTEASPQGSPGAIFQALTAVALPAFHWQAGAAACPKFWWVRI